MGSSFLRHFLHPKLIMIYDIRVEFKDGTVEKFQRKSNIKPINSFRLHDQIANQIFPREWKEICSNPVY